MFPFAIPPCALICFQVAGTSLSRAGTSPFLDLICSSFVPEEQIPVFSSALVSDQQPSSPAFFPPPPIRFFFVPRNEYPAHAPGTPIVQRPAISRLLSAIRYQPSAISPIRFFWFQKKVHLIPPAIRYQPSAISCSSSIRSSFVFFRGTNTLLVGSVLLIRGDYIRTFFHKDVLY